MPISRQVRMTRTAISPRLAMRTFFNTRTSVRACHFLPLVSQTLMFRRVSLNRFGESSTSTRSIRPTRWLWPQRREGAPEGLGRLRRLSERRSWAAGPALGVAPRVVAAVLDTAASPDRRTRRAAARGGGRRTVGAAALVRLCGVRPRPQVAQRPARRRRASWRVCSPRSSRWMTDSAVVVGIGVNLTHDGPDDVRRHQRARTRRA